MNTIFYQLSIISCLLVLAQACKPSAPSEEQLYARQLDSLAASRMDTPQLYLPGVVSTSDHDEGGYYETTVGEAYFWRRIPGEKQRIYRQQVPTVTSKVVARVGDTLHMGRPKAIAISTDRDENAFVTSDGLTMYFGSEREIPGRPNLGNFDMNIWVTSRDDLSSPWQEPRPLPPVFNRVQAEGEKWPVANVSAVFSPDDSEFYVSTQNPGDSATRLYVYRRDAADNLIEPQEIFGLFPDQRISVGGAVLSPDGQYLIFNSYAALGGRGGEDLYVSRSEGYGRWSPAVPLDKVNTEHEEAGASFSADGATMYFGRAHVLDAAAYEYDVWNVYSIPTRSLQLSSLFSPRPMAARDMGR